MNIAIGNDIIEINRFKDLNPRFINKVYTENEEKILCGKPHRLAGNFAAKEAVAKVLGTGFSSVFPKDIEILREENGKPICILHDSAKTAAEKALLGEIAVSISHCREYASATAAAERIIK